MRSRGPAYFIRFGLIGLAALVFVSGLAYLVLNNSSPPPPPEIDLPVISTPTSALTAAPLETTPLTPMASPRPTVTPSPTSAVPPGGIVYALSPDINSVGWVQSGEAGNHFGESYLYTGRLDDVLYHGAIQFDLSFIPDTSIIFMAELELTGLGAEDLMEGSAFTVNILATEIDLTWSRHDFEIINNAPIEEILIPTLETADLGPSQMNILILNAAQRSLIEERLKTNFLSLRLDSGPVGRPPTLPAGARADGASLRFGE